MPSKPLRQSVAYNKIFCHYYVFENLERAASNPTYLNYFSLMLNYSVKLVIVSTTGDSHFIYLLILCKIFIKKELFLIFNYVTKNIYIITNFLYITFNFLYIQYLGRYITQYKIKYHNLKHYGYFRQKKILNVKTIAWPQAVLVRHVLTVTR